MKTYQKGETVVFNALVKNQNGDIISNEVVKLYVKDPEGTSVVDGYSMQPAEGGVYEGTYLVPLTAETGMYSVWVQAGPETSKSTIQRGGFKVVE